MGVLVLRDLVLKTSCLYLQLSILLKLSYSGAVTQSFTLQFHWVRFPTCWSPTACTLGGRLTLTFPRQIEVHEYSVKEHLACIDRHSGDKDCRDPSLVLHKQRFTGQVHLIELRHSQPKGICRVRSTSGTNCQREVLNQPAFANKSC